MFAYEHIIFEKRKKCMVADWWPTAWWPKKKMHGGRLL